MKNLLGRISSLFKPVIQRYEELPKDTQYQFRVTLRNFGKWYSYISQLDRTFDMQLLEENIFTNYLLKFIPREQREKVDVADKVKLEYYKLQKEFSGDIFLVAEDPESGKLTNKQQIDAGIKPPDERDSLDEIIHRMNERFPDDFTEKDKVLLEALYRSFENNPDMKVVSMAKTNSQEMFVENLFKDVFQDKVMAEYDQNQQAFEKLVGADDAYYKLVYTLLAKDLYKSYRSKV